jgi:alpha-galactosidase/6-phospho-beta-glucosidase family protein
VVLRERRGGGRQQQESDGDTSLEALRKSMDARYSAVERSQYERLKKEANEAKAKQIKAEIRKLHIETSAVEKETKERTEAELKRIQEAAESEEIHLKKRQVSFPCPALLSLSDPLSLLSTPSHLRL